MANEMSVTRLVTAISESVGGGIATFVIGTLAAATYYLAYYYIVRLYPDSPIWKWLRPRTLSLIIVCVVALPILAIAKLKRINAASKLDSSSAGRPQD